MLRTEREFERRGEENGKLVRVAEIRGEVADWRRLWRKKIEQTGGVENKRVISALLSEQLARTSERSLPNEKGPSNPSLQITRL